MIITLHKLKLKPWLIIVSKKERLWIISYFVLIVPIDVDPQVFIKVNIFILIKTTLDSKVKYKFLTITFQIE